MFKYQMHLHTSACSACARSTAAEMVQKLAELGYAGAVITNHFYHGNTSIDRHSRWEDFLEHYKQDYLTARKLGRELGVDILFGIEEVYERGKEALIYGLEPEDLIYEPSFLNMEISEMSDFVRQKGGFIACAHPFRVRSYIPDPDRDPNPAYFDGVEVFNYCNPPEENQKAVEYAARHGLAPISGGDVHHTDGLGMAGLAFESRIQNGVELVAALKSRDYRLIVGEDIV